MNENLITALKEFLENTLKERTMCPRCVGYLPRHEPDCLLGKLAEAYMDTELPVLQFVPISSRTKTGRSRKTKATKKMDMFGGTDDY